MYAGNQGTMGGQEIDNKFYSLVTDSKDTITQKQRIRFLKVTVLVAVCVGVTIGLFTTLGDLTVKRDTPIEVGQATPELQSDEEWPPAGSVISLGVAEDKIHVPLMPFGNDYTMIEDQGLTRVVLSDGVYADGVISKGAAVDVDISLEVDNSLQIANENYSQRVDISVFFDDWQTTNNSVAYNTIKNHLYSGADFGRLTIPRINLKTKIVRYGAQPQIDIGLCQYASWDLPGGEGVSLLAAHNYNPDWKIGELKIGDHIYYSTVYGNLEYQVYGATVNYDGRDTYWLKDSYYAANPTDLVLMTCYPFDSDGTDGVRYLVFAKKVGGPSIVGEPTTDMERYGSFAKFEQAVNASN